MLCCRGVGASCPIVLLPIYQIYLIVVSTRQQEVLLKGAPACIEFQNNVYALLLMRGSGRMRLLDAGEGQTQNESDAFVVI
ncbi:hypothetical protein PR001_g24288 [Phytophthora rubi]|uniref:Uncharacterized protein n=1 Tax=Phytophthora rubi TaxID=129364 RepID=A0A6A3I6S8_9STRA|nr:hypothetical protein PR002_g24908 [Phytophthora rubi]KAE8980383.1 hypothetical protein PR001_g24288 [Phytophthora rubi]